MPARASRSAQDSPAGPAPITATRLPVATTRDRSGRQPSSSAASTMYFSTAPMVTAPKPSLSVQLPSHRRSCGQTRPQISGSGLVSCASAAASCDAAFARQLQPVRDVVVQRALPRAVRIAAVQAAPGLVLGLGVAEAAVHLAPVAALAQLQRDPRRHLPRRLAEGEQGRPLACCFPSCSRDLRLRSSPLAGEAPLVGGAPKGRGSDAHSGARTCEASLG